MVVEVFDFLENPRVADGGAANHDGIHTIALFVFQRLGRGVDVAVADDGNGHSRIVFHFSDKGPVGGAPIKLRAGASMNSNGLYSNILQLFGGGHDVLVQFIPAKSRFDGNWQFDAVDYCAGQPHHLGNVLKDGRAGTFVDHFLYGAAPVDVDEVGVCGLGHFGSFA